MQKTDLLSIVNIKREKAKSTLEEIKVLLEHKFLSTAMNRIYYAGFYIVSALVLLDDFSTSKHKQLIGYFNREYVYRNKVSKDIGGILKLAYENRIVSDYHDFSKLTKTQVKEFYKDMKKFVKTIDNIIDEKLNNKINIS